MRMQNGHACMYAYAVNHASCGVRRCWSYERKRDKTKPNPTEYAGYWGTLDTRQKDKKTCAATARQARRHGRKGYKWGEWVEWVE